MSHKNSAEYLEKYNLLKEQMEPMFQQIRDQMRTEYEDCLNETVSKAQQSLNEHWRQKASVLESKIQALE